jgi:pimeloyl-ACP methyl ester carboxylesterase
MAAEVQHQFVTVNSVRLHVASAGKGPLVLLCHGWPELWLSWRHQLPALASAGFRAVAPDMRGFGQSDAPPNVQDYSLLHLVGDMVGLVRALGEERAVIVGHDWGAPVAWSAAMMRPDLFHAVVALSVPHRRRGPAQPLRIIREAGVNRFYWIYFQEPGVAEAELERDVAATMRRLLYSGSGDAPLRQELPLVLPEGGGLLTLTIDPPQLPDWLDQETLDTMTAEYRRTGFRGGLNYYRNIDRNWELLAPWDDVLIRQPALFIAGTRDVVITGPMGQKALADLPANVPGLRGKVLLEGAGHWIQQERPQAANDALIGFLSGL